MAKVWTGKWAGGRIAQLKSGKRWWVLERRWQGRQHTIPLLKVRDEEGAAAALYAWTGTLPASSTGTSTSNAATVGQ
jgi:hypothetical protein